jgi:hypothetical protein
MQLYRLGAMAPLLDYASQRFTAEQILDQVAPDWRDHRSTFEVYNDADGGKAIRVRSSG